MERQSLVIAHRGACGYLPEHSLAGKAMACAMGADFLEQDVLLTRDDRPIVFHDHVLDAMTNVAEIFPDKKRKDGLHYAVDFSLAEIKKLRLHDRVNRVTGKQAYPNRFPHASITPFEIPTLEEEIELVQGINTSTGKSIGIYMELKSPSYHRQEGKVIEDIVLGILRDYGYRDKDSKCYLQSFEPESIRYMRDDLKSGLTMVQLIGDNTWDDTPGVDYARMVTPEGLDEVAKYADIIGPWMNQIVEDRGKGHDPVRTRLVELAHERGLRVHPFTFRADALPSYAATFDDLLDIFYCKMSVDGVFTDFPDQAAAFLKKVGLR